MISDVVIVVYEPELPLAVLQAETIARFIDKKSVGRIIYCINDEIPEQTSDFLHRNVFPVLEGVGLCVLELKRDHFSNKCGSGYCLQQIQKLESAFRVETEYYISFDTKNFLVKDFSLNELFSGPCPSVFYETYEENDFRRYMKEMYLSYWNIEKPYGAIMLPAMATPFVFRTKIVRDMINDIEKRERRSFGFFFEERFGGGGGYSEFLLYSSYVYSCQLRAVCSQALSLTSWDETPITAEEIGRLIDVARANPSLKMCGIHRRRFGPVVQRTVEEIRKAIGF